MTIQQSPLSLSLLGNMLHLVISSDADVTMTLSLGNEQLVAHTYSPDSAGLIDVDLRDIASAHLTFSLHDTQVPYRQDGIVRTFSGTLTCGEQTEQFGFTVIRAGVDQLADTPSNFLAQNFLTWQPTVKPVTYYTPEFLTYYAEQACTVKCVAYSSNGSGTSIRLGSLSAGGCYTIPTGYAVIAGRAGFLPSYYDVWIENQGGTRLTYIQRYYASDIKSEEEEWILFENSLGGIDTFRAYGDSENTSEHKHQVAEIEEESVEYRVDTERKHKKSTGLLDKYERRWLLDFFPSKGKFIYADQSIRRIVVTDSDVSYNVKELPSEYNFTYKFAEAKPYLNLPRTDATLQEMHIEVPDVGSFTIAPRLAEFPRQALSGGALFPVQNPYSESWGVTTLAALAMYLSGDVDFAESIVQNGLSENDVQEIIREFVDGKFLSKVNDDEAAGEITFRKGLISLLRARFGNYLRSDAAMSGASISPDGIGDFLGLLFGSYLKSIGATDGFNGSGITMTASDGRIQADALEIRGWMRVAKLVYNMIQIMEQDYQFSGGGDIEDVVDNEDTTYTLHIHKEKEGRHTSFADFDILYGKVDELQQGGMYYTSWMRVCENGVTLNEGMTADTVRVELWSDNMVPGNRNFAPKKMMTVARRGNTQDTTRQSFWELSTTDERITYYWHVDQPKLRADNYALCLGILPTILDEAGVLPDTRDPRMPSLYVNTIFYENSHHIYYPSFIMKVDRGEWAASPASKYTGVNGTYTHDGTLSDENLDTEVSAGRMNADDADKLKVIRTWGGTFIQGQTIEEPYHFESFSRNMWLTHRLSPAHLSLTDLMLFRKMNKEWHVDKETSRAWRYGALWECLVEGTAQTPELGCSDWTLIQKPAISLAFFTTDNVPLQMLSIRDGVEINETIKPMLMFGQYDMSSTVRRWQWERESAYEALDEAWAGETRARRQVITLTGNDFPAGWESTGLSFKCTAWFGDGGDESEITNVINVF